MVQANNNGVTYDIGVSVEKAVADLARGEARIVKAVEQAAARASKVGRIALGMDFNEAAVRKRMADLIKDMRNQAAGAKIEMEARVRLFGPDGQTPVDQWAARSKAFGGNGVWQQGAKGGRLESMIGSGGVSGGGGGGGSSGGGGGNTGGGIADLLGKRSDLKNFGEILRGGGAIVGVTLLLDTLGRATGQMRQLRDETRMTDRSAYDLATSFGRAIPVLGQLITLGDELGQLVTGQNFDLARTLEVSGAVQAATQQVFQLQREVNRIVADIDRKNADIQRDIGVIQTAPGAPRTEAQAAADLTTQIADVDAQIKAETDSIKQKYSDLLTKPFDITIDPNLKVSAKAQEGVRQGLSLEKMLEDAVKEEARLKSLLESSGARLVYDSKIERATKAREEIERDIALVREAEKTQTATVKAPLEERKGLLQQQADATKAERDRIDKQNAGQIGTELQAARERGGMNIREAERLELVKQLADREREAAAIGEESLRKQKALSEEILRNYDERAKVLREEGIISDEARKEVTELRIEGDYEWAAEIERARRDEAEIREAERGGASDEELDSISRRQNADEELIQREKANRSEIAVARSKADVQQASLRASQQFYDAEVYAIEQAYAEQLRIAETSEDKMTAITVAENQKRARMIELEAQTEQRAKDAGFEANQIRLRREGKEMEAQRAAIVRQAQDELKQVGDNANARDAIFERTKQQLLELQDAEGMRRGVGSWVADSIYSTAPNRPRTDTLNETNQNELLKLLPNRAGDFYPTALGAGIASALQAVPKDSRAGGIFGMAQDMVALMQSEVAAMNQASKPVKTDADSKVEIRGEVVTLLRQVAENTGKATTAVFAP